jgi:dTDP-glucose 4,6-dehydratase
MIFTPKKMLVTGGCGFIGSNFIHHLTAHAPEVEIINLDNLSFAANPDNVKSLPASAKYQFVHGDITDKTLIKKILQENNIDTIVHFAAESHVDRSITDPGSFVHSNIVGTYTLLEAARQGWLEEKKLTHKECLFYHISTDEVYGTLGPNDPAFTEQTPYAPNSPYSASKAGSDHLVRAYFETYGLPVVISNCSNNYGPRQHGEKLIPTIIRSCLNEQPIPVYGDGSNIRDWLYVMDHCEAIYQLVQKGVRGECYNIGGNQEKNNLTVVKTICQLLDKIKPRANGASYADLIAFVKDRLGHDWRYAINPSKMEALGWQPKETFESGILKTLDFYLNN